MRRIIAKERQILEQLNRIEAKVRQIEERQQARDTTQESLKRLRQRFREILWRHSP